MRLIYRTAPSDNAGIMASEWSPYRALLSAVLIATARSMLCAQTTPERREEYNSAVQWLDSDDGTLDLMCQVCGIKASNFRELLYQVHAIRKNKSLPKRVREGEIDPAWLRGADGLEGIRLSRGRGRMVMRRDAPAELAGVLSRFESKRRETKNMARSDQFLVAEAEFSCNSIPEHMVREAQELRETIALTQTRLEDLTRRMIDFAPVKPGDLILVTHGGEKRAAMVDSIFLCHTNGGYRWSIWVRPKLRGRPGYFANRICYNFPNDATITRVIPESEE